MMQLVRAGLLERCKWVPRRRTEDSGSEGYFRFVKGGDA